MKSILAREVMTSPVITILPDISLQEAVTILDSNVFTGLPVVNENQEIIGMITEKDIIRYTKWIIGLPLKDPSQVLQEAHEATNVVGQRGADMVELVAETTVDTIMTQKVYKVREDDSLFHIVRLLNQKEINRVPVVDYEGVLTGIITRADILRKLEDWFIEKEE